MRIALTTVDLFQGRERLMPWRTIIEVARYANRNGHKADVLTLPVSKENVGYKYEDVNVKTAPRDFEAFCDYIKKYEYDCVVYPTPWREALKNLSAFKNLKCWKVAYFPGGSYRLANIIALWKVVGRKTAMPYLVDWLTPYRMLMGKLKDNGFTTVIAQSPYTANTCEKGGFKDVRMIVPGKDDFDALKNDETVFQRLNIKQKKYLLFSGAPAPIRGASLLLKAIDCLPSDHDDVSCLFLMRKDVGSDFSEFETTYKKMKHKERVQILYEKVNREELKTIMSHARAVVLPFVLVPSEIPITFFEVLSLGTPVVTFDNGGTTDYLGGVVLKSKPGNIAELGKNIVKIWNDEKCFDSLRAKSLEFMQQHPTWDDVCKEWMKGIIE